MMLAAFVLGFLGSFHCLGMCSPLVMAVINWQSPFFLNRFVYNIARIVCYGVQGALISKFGSLFNFSQFQTFFSVSLGGLLIVLGLVGATNFKLPLIANSMQKVAMFIKTIFSRFLVKRNILSLFVLGFLNGLLPCGLTYLALTYCIILPSIMGGFLFMFFFGLGTFPVMLGLTSFAQEFVKKIRFNFQKLTVVAMLAVGVVLIARGFWQHSSNSVAASIVVCQPK
jgi:uncharacterized protein